jgi:hypothetical protein
MVCPKCQREMTLAKVAFKMPFLSLNFGLTSKDLVFHDAAGASQRVLNSNQQQQAFRCQGCGSVLIVDGPV